MRRELMGLIVLVGGVASLYGFDTTIKGGTMELLEKGDTIIFRNGVRMDRGGDTILADQMKTNKKRDKVNAWGNVRLSRRVDEKETWRGFGTAGFYNTQSGDGYLLGKKDQAHIIYEDVLSSTATRKIDIFSDRFDFRQEGQYGQAQGHVYGKTTDTTNGDFYEFWAQKAYYYGEEGKMILTGDDQPKVRQTKEEDHSENIIIGDVITYFVESKRLVSEGNAQVFFAEDDTPRD